MYEVALKRFEVVVVVRGRCLKCATVVCAPLQGPVSHTQADAGVYCGLCLPTARLDAS